MGGGRCLRGRGDRNRRRHHDCRSRCIGRLLACGRLCRSLRRYRRQWRLRCVDGYGLNRDGLNDCDYRRYRAGNGRRCASDALLGGDDRSSHNHSRGLGVIRHHADGVESYRDWRWIGLCFGDVDCVRSDRLGGRRVTAIDIDNRVWQSPYAESKTRKSDDGVTE